MDPGSEASKRDLRERRERQEEREAEGEVLGAESKLSGGAEPPLLPPIPSFMASAEEE